MDSFLITKEVTDYVVCQVCGERLRRINHTHLMKHNLTSTEYRELYPDANLTSDLTNKKHSDSIKGQNNPNFGITGEKHHFFGKHRTQESIQKMSESKSGEKHHFFGKHHTAKTKKKMSEGNKGKTRSDEHKAKMSEAKSGENNPMFGRTGEKSPLFGKHLSDDHKQKMSETRREGLRSGRIKISKQTGSSKSGYRPDLGIFVRSTWEANIARILNYQGITYTFEPKRFNLGDYTYLPDFYLPEEDIWIEIKGYMREDDELKIRLFRKMGYNLTVIDKPAYKQLEKEYKSLIPNWETSKSTNIVRRIHVTGRAIKGNFTYRNVKKLFRKREKKK